MSQHVYLFTRREPTKQGWQVRTCKWRPTCKRHSSEKSEAASLCNLVLLCFLVERPRLWQTGCELWLLSGCELRVYACSIAWLSGCCDGRTCCSFSRADGGQQIDSASSCCELPPWILPRLYVRTTVNDWLKIASLDAGAGWHLGAANVCPLPHAHSRCQDHRRAGLCKSKCTEPRIARDLPTNKVNKAPNGRRRVLQAAFMRSIPLAQVATSCGQRRAGCLSFLKGLALEIHDQILARTAMDSCHESIKEHSRVRFRCLLLNVLLLGTEAVEPSRTSYRTVNSVLLYVFGHDVIVVIPNLCLWRNTFKSNISSTAPVQLMTETCSRSNCLNGHTREMQNGHKIASQRQLTSTKRRCVDPCKSSNRRPRFIPMMLNIAQRHPARKWQAPRKTFICSTPLLHQSSMFATLASCDIEDLLRPFTFMMLFLYVSISRSISSCHPARIRLSVLVRGLLEREAFPDDMHRGAHLCIVDHLRNVDEFVPGRVEVHVVALHEHLDFFDGSLGLSGGIVLRQIDGYC